MAVTEVVVNDTYSIGLPSSGYEGNTSYSLNIGGTGGFEIKVDLI